MKCILDTATRCNTLQHAASTLQHAASYCNIPHHTAAHLPPKKRSDVHCICDTATHCNTLQHKVTYFNILHHNAIHCITSACRTRLACTTFFILQHTATHCHTLQHTASCCNTLYTCLQNKPSMQRHLLLSILLFDFREVRQRTSGNQKDELR